MNTNFKVIGLIRLGITPESTVPEADALTTRAVLQFSLTSLAPEEEVLKSFKAAVVQLFSLQT